MQDASKSLCDVAAQLVEAACSALQGDAQLAKSRIERAIGLLRKDHRSAPITVAQKRIAQIVRGGLAPWQARRVAAHIDEKLTSTIRVEDLAALVSLSKSHFSRAFKCTFGQCAHAYLMRRRIELAQG